MRRAAGSPSHSPRRRRSSSRPTSSVGGMGRGTFRSSSTAASSPAARELATNASRMCGVRSSAAESARTVSRWGRRRSPRSSALIACTERPAMVASSSWVNPAASRSDLRCAPNDRGAASGISPTSYARCTGVLRPVYGRRTSAVDGVGPAGTPDWTYEHRDQIQAVAPLCGRRSI
jgi:hypothetical protein